MSNISYRRLDELLEKRPLPMKFGQVHLGLAKPKEEIREQREPITNAEGIEVAELEIDEPTEPVHRKSRHRCPTNRRCQTRIQNSGQAQNQHDGPIGSIETNPK